ncbi:MAG TPA: VTT domain-containing protein [Longimicrobiaceae bacterium]|nr:VTT domain-containing protein [Longimicrobiaceae bacterium]
MRRYWMMLGGLLLVFLALFVIATAAGVPILSDPSPWMGQGSAAAAAVGVGLLTADVFLPVPSSAVMLAHGALFGVWTGALLSLAGSLGAAALGFAVGRAGNDTVRRLVTPAEHERAGALLQRWGALAIVASRPVPMLAETVAVLAGASPMPWPKAMLAALAGSLPAALAYAVAGAGAASVGVSTIVFGGVVLLGGVFWWLGRRAQRKKLTVTQR